MQHGQMRQNRTQWAQKGDARDAEGAWKGYAAGIWKRCGWNISYNCLSCLAIA